MNASVVRTDALILMFTLNFRYYFYVKKLLILFLLFFSISFKANSIQLSETNEFDDLLVNTVLKCSNDYKKDLFLPDEGIYTFKRTSNLPVDYLDCAYKLKEKYSSQITNSKPKIILHQIDNEWGFHVQRFPDGGKIHLLFTRGDKDVIFEKDGYILDSEYSFKDENDDKRLVIFSEKLSYDDKDILVDVFDYEGEGKSCFTRETFKTTEVNDFRLDIYKILENKGLSQLCGYEPRIRLDIDTLQDDEYGLLKSLVENFNLDDPLDICFDGGIYNYDTYTNNLYICTLRANSSLLSEISDEFLEFYNNYNDFGDTYNEKKYIELCKLNNGGVGIFYDSKDDCQIP